MKTGETDVQVMKQKINVAQANDQTDEIAILYSLCLR